jgi:hypothetical protein
MCIFWETLSATLPRDADWREILAPDITPEKILQTV